MLDIPTYECFCGAPALVGRRFCASCAPPPPGASREIQLRPPQIVGEVTRGIERITRTNGTAVMSFLSGLAAWMAVPIVGAFFAVWAGHKARKELAVAGQLETGWGLATAGLALGYAQLGLVGGVVGLAGWLIASG